MDILAITLTIVGLALFETISSIDNAIINAEVLGTMSAKARRWFLIWGILIAVFLVRGLLPWIIIWASAPDLGFLGSLTATFSNDPKVHEIIEKAAPPLLMGGGVFLILLFFHWLFLEEKHLGLPHEKFFQEQGIWFYTIAALVLTFIVYFSLQISGALAFGAVVGSTAFFITHGFKQNAEAQEQRLLSGKSGISDISKILYLEIIDATFSIDGVLGAFAFTLSVPLILAGNGLGAVLVRQLTVSNMDTVKKFRFLKNGAMYSVLALGAIMVTDGFGIHVPQWVSPVSTFVIIGYFFGLSVWDLKKNPV